MFNSTKPSSVCPNLAEMSLLQSRLRIKSKETIGSTKRIKSFNNIVSEIRSIHGHTTMKSNSHNDDYNFVWLNCAKPFFRKEYIQRVFNPISKINSLWVLYSSNYSDQHNQCKSENTVAWLDQIFWQIRNGQNHSKKDKCLGSLKQIDYLAPIRIPFVAGQKSKNRAVHQKVMNV